MASTTFMCNAALPLARLSSTSLTTAKSMTLSANQASMCCTTLCITRYAGACHRSTTHIRDNANVKSAFNTGNRVSPCRAGTARRQRPTTPWHPLHGETGQCLPLLHLHFSVLASAQLEASMLPTKSSPSVLKCAQAARVLDDYQYGRDFIDPSHVKDGGVTKDHTRQWKVLQELQVCCLCTAPYYNVQFCI